MIYELKMWISAEVVDPFFSLYSYVYKNFVLVLSLSFCVIVLLCALNPSIVFTPKKEGFVVYKPEFQIKHGRMTSLIIKRGNKKFLLIVHILKMRMVHFVNYISLENYLKLREVFFLIHHCFLKVSIL
ncbi:hypothetical protein ACTJJH_14840 [Acinetobacter sp. 22301]|uniref:hypothetical protein n=1 Tax=Acinetobacter sp. 22301 TaxID=3453904 RepID=UPI003F87FC3C